MRDHPRRDEYVYLYSRGFTVSEIARMCGKKKSTVSSRLKAARLALQKKPDPVVSKPCPHSPSCFTCPMKDCVLGLSVAIQYNVI